MPGAMNLVNLTSVDEIRRRIPADVRDFVIMRSESGGAEYYHATVELRSEGLGRDRPGKWAIYAWDGQVNRAHPYPEIDAMIRMVDDFTRQFRVAHPGIRNVIPIRRNKRPDERASRIIRSIRASMASEAQNRAARELPA